MYLQLIVILFLLYACVADIRKRKISNNFTILLLMIAVGYRLYLEQFGLLMLSIVVMFLFGIALYFAGIGAGDSKLMIAIGPLLPFMDFSGFVIKALMFMFLFGLIGGLYGMTATIQKRSTKALPMLPVFLICYSLVLVARF